MRKTPRVGAQHGQAWQGHITARRTVFGFGDFGRVWVKLSGAYRRGKRDLNFVRNATTQLLDRFGARRLMWGSGWPHTQFEHVTG
jgi:predicted TIM-barrel fold metal-dependent hydrolase